MKRQSNGFLIRTRMEFLTIDLYARIKRVEKNSVILEEYVYDRDGERLQVTENSVTTTYIRSGLDILYLLLAYSKNTK
jgi:hypothetical protein